MTTLRFRTNINCNAHVEKAVCGLECLRGRFCKFSLNMEETDRTLTIQSAELCHRDVVQVMKKEGIICEPLEI